METIYLPAVFPDDYRCVYIAQFDHVKNGSELRHALVQASKTPVHSDERRRMDMAFVDARLVCSRQQLITAILQAIVGAQRRDIKREELEPLAITGLKTPSIHSDILWTLNPNNNIGDALRRFGVSAATSSLLLVHVAKAPPEGPQPQAVAQQMNDLVDGTLLHGITLSMDASSDATGDKIPAEAWKDVGKTYKIQDAPAYSQHDTQQVNACICSMVASKYVGL